VKLADDVGGAVFATVGAVEAVGVILALICAAKEKFWMALGSLVVWPVGIVGAVRLAKPHSLWARRFYRDERLKRANVRYSAQTA
jgi:hypothetical protein